MESIYQHIIEHFPFGIVFAKKAPDNINDDEFRVNYTQDFCYYYFSPLFDYYTLLKRQEMCSGCINAARDFPDYLQYFEDDINVVKNYRNGRVLVICEPWNPPGMDTYVYTRKTALVCKAGLFMLGVFSPVDDLILGVARFKRIFQQDLREHQQSSLLGKDIDPDWFKYAFQSMPVGLAVVDASNVGVILDSNDLWARYGADIANINQVCSSKGISMSSHNFMHEAILFSNFSSGSYDKIMDLGIYGVQVNDKSLIAIMLRPSMDSETPTPIKAWRCNYT